MNPHQCPRLHALVRAVTINPKPRYAHRMQRTACFPILVGLHVIKQDQGIVDKVEWVVENGRRIGGKMFFRIIVGNIRIVRLAKSVKGPERGGVMPVVELKSVSSASYREDNATYQLERKDSKLFRRVAVLLLEQICHMCSQ